MNTMNVKRKTLKKIICFSATFILILSSFCIPSFADNSTIPTFPIGDNSSNGTDGLELWDNRFFFSSISNVYCFSVLNSSNTYSFYSVSESSDYYLIYRFNGSEYYNNVSSNNSIYDQDTELYYFIISTLGGVTPLVPSFSDLNSGLSATIDTINNSSSSDYPLLYDYDLPNGNVAYIQAMETGDTITISATFPQQSTLFSDSWSPMTMKYNWVPLTSGGIVSIHTSFPYSGQLDLPLVKSGDTNLLGQSKTGNCTLTQVASNSLELYNPSYRQVNASNQDQYLLNPSIHIHCDSGFAALSVYPLKESLTPGGITATSDTTHGKILQHTPESTPEDPSSEWVGPDTTTSTTPPASGGDNDLPETFTIGDYLNKLHDTLSNFAKSVVSLLEQPIEHISDLIQAGSGFMGALRGIYAWLPVDIQGLVISALTVVIGIGVFKVFL